MFLFSPCSPRRSVQPAWREKVPSQCRDLQCLRGILGILADDASFVLSNKAPLKCRDPVALEAGMLPGAWGTWPWEDPGRLTDPKKGDDCGMSS